ncbi:EamA family transporter [Streptomyces rubellomurinus]|uniref:Membrane protein n=2 Tax=Streptomyces TaxID=1883 RepID=A0A0F2T973_STRR3|nr:EamA family transporter [Streptomyces rubellomurinus]KJS57167.1 membrane protein [Streptomyces rubellomurinus subsp. indigoferus]KJS59763.1 membrane protein [Streptomyces rubellomurinus]
MTALLALTASLLTGLGDFGGGVLTRRLPALAVVVVSQATATVVLLLAVLATGGWADASPALWYAVAAGVIGPFAMLAFYRALALGPMGVVSPLATVGVAVPVGVGLALGERPGPGQLAGIAVAVAGVVLAGGPERGGPSAARTALLLTLAAAFGFGANMALLSRASAGGGLLLVLCVQRLVNVAVGGAALVVEQRGADTAGLLPDLRSRLPLLTAVGLADVAGNAAYALAAHAGSAAVAAVLASLYPVVTALLARGLLKERLRPVQVVGAGLAVAGTLLLAAA